MSGRSSQSIERKREKDRQKIAAKRADPLFRETENMIERLRWHVNAQDPEFLARHTLRKKLRKHARTTLHPNGNGQS